jgi:hypothetical protein
MNVKWSGFFAVPFALLLIAAGSTSAQDLPMEPTHNSGSSVTGAYEGWFPNADGSYSLLVGYFNRNLKQAVDVPIGPTNRVDPGGPDQGQPTHFLPGRGWGMFTIKVPKDFGDRILTWTIVVNGTSTSVPLSLKPLWRIAPFVDATGDTPAYIGFRENGPFVNGPVGQSESLTATAGVAFPITIWVADDAKSPALPSTPPAGGVTEPDPAAADGPVSIHLTQFRGPGSVHLEAVKPKVERLQELKSAPAGTIFYGKGTTTVTLSEPGDYILAVQAFDSTGEGGQGFLCCWSNAQIKVSVKSAAGN